MSHSAGLRGGVESTFSQEQRICLILLGHHERLSRMGTARGKRTHGICGPALEVYVSCVSGFHCRVYIDSNHHDSQI
jgi:hypothetical protein